VKLPKIFKFFAKPTAQEYNTTILENASRDLAKALVDLDYIQGVIVGLNRTIERLNGEKSENSFEQNYDKFDIFTF
jgi:hypothetical protein